MQDLTSLSDEQLLELHRKTKQKIAEYNNTQMALKILLNGGYGAMSNEHNRWYSDDIAESITLSGQLSARWIIQHLNRFFNQLFKTVDQDYVVATDTDSVHLNVEPAIRKAFGDQIPSHDEVMHFLDNLSKKMDQVIAQGYEDLSQELNVFDKAMHMKLETMSKAIWTGKKHYVMEVWSNEGIRYNPPKIKIVGMDAVKSSTPKIVREWMKTSINMALQLDQAGLKRFFIDKLEEFKTLKFDQIAFPRGITDIEKYYDPVEVYGSKCPPHVRAALLYNKLVKDKKLTNQLPLIESGDKIRYCWMLLPNPLRENIFACPDVLPEILEMDQYIDYHTQYEKSFVEPMMHLLNAAKIRITNNVDISQFF